jgi:fermentation-respiration switch protein FrsA (DUF1100 family)
VSYLGIRPEVDAKRIGALGICGGGGYAPNAAATDRRIKAVATVSGVGDQRTAIRGQLPEHAVLLATLEATAAARQAYSQGDEPLYFPLLPGPETKNVYPPIREAPVYYFDASRGAHPRWENKVLSWSLEKQLSFSALDVIGLISPHPLLLVVGSKSSSRSENEAAYAAAQEPKELFLIEGASHVDLYDQDRYVTPVVDKLAAFFDANL